MTRSLARALLATTALAFSMSAYADDLVTNDRAGLADAPNKLVFSLPAWQSHTFSAVPAWADGFKKAYTDFITAHPDWQIEFQYNNGDSGQVAATLIEQAKAGKAPDCAAMDSFVLQQVIDAKVLSPMTPYFKDAAADAFPFVKAAVTGADGQIYAWWWTTDVKVLFRNTEFVPDAPKTWDELKAAALKTVAAGKEGVLFNGARWEGTTFDWLPNFWAQGGELVDASGKPVFGDATNRDKFVKAVNYYKDLVDSGAAPKRVLTIKQYLDMEAAATAGTTALFIGNNGDWGNLKSGLDPAEFKKWAFSPLPGPTADQQATGAGGWVFGSFAKDEKKVEFCADLIKDVYDVKANQIMSFLPTETGLFAKYPEFSTPDNQAFAAALATAKTRPGIALYPEISNQIQIMMGDVLSGTKPVDDAVDTAFKASLDAYAKQ